MKNIDRKTFLKAIRMLDKVYKTLGGNEFTGTDAWRRMVKENLEECLEYTTGEMDVFFGEEENDLI